MFEIIDIMTLTKPNTFYIPFFLRKINLFNGKNIGTIFFRYTIDQFGREALKATKNLQINSMCKVFAESEVTSLVAKGEDPREIALGLHRSAVRRAVSMLKRVSVGNDIVFDGGVAKNPCMRYLLEEALERQLLVSEDSQMVRALGAALLAGENT